MKQSILSVNVKVSNGDSLIDGLCVENASNAQLGAILNLCKPPYHVDIDFISSDFDFSSADLLKVNNDLTQKS